MFKRRAYVSIILSLPDSSKDFANSTDVPPTNFEPSFSSMKPCTAYVIRSDRKARIIHKR